MNPQDKRAQLEARNAAMRQQVDSLLDGLNRQIAALTSAQAKAGEVTGQATSADGLVTATVNAAGIVTDVQFAPSAFDRGTPDRLARSVVAVIQQAAADAQQEVDTVLAPIRGGLPDLPDVFPEAPALRDLLPNPNLMSAHQRPQPPEEDEDFSARSVLRGGDR
ncbi:MAG: YbaB/EbfC family nucleoid-associated protein [Pseudonocardiaceae bacterium]